MNAKTKRVLISLVLGVTLLIGLLLVMGAARLPHVALAQGPTIRYVSSTGDDSGNDCTNSSTPCATVQYAVDMADPGDEILVATGTYTGVQARLRKDLMTTGLVTQVVYISKTITLRGGYITTNWTTAYPITQPTTLDAQGQGRVLYITGNISPTIEGLRITGGKAELGGGIAGDKGGGVYIISATVTIRNSQIFSNIARTGGGLRFDNSPGAMLVDNLISGNNASGNAPAGGGLYFESSPDATLIDNAIIGNTAAEGPGVKSGGGLFCNQSDSLMLTSNVISGNLVFNYGGGLFFSSCTNIGLTNNIIRNNSASEYGGGLLLRESTGMLTNNIIVDNQSFSPGSGLRISNSSLHVLHTTVARNSTDSGVYITNNGIAASSVTLTNTILVGHNTGISVTVGNTATLNGVLWHNNGVNTGGDGIFIITNEHTGDPAFAADGYHLTAASAAIDKGVNTGVNDDIDGDPRPMGQDYDLGADELPISLIITKQAAPDPVQMGALLTYTIRVSNTGLVTLTATITDYLPFQVQPIGPLVWLPTTIAPDDVWVQQVQVQVNMGCPLVNVVKVTTAEGAVGIYTTTTTVIGPCLWLPVVVKNTP